MPGPRETPYVRQLQRDLRQLGFGIVGPDNGVFGRRTEWAVREFQIYSKMPFVAVEAGRAKRYTERLSAVANSARFDGHAGGVVDRKTRSLMRHWLANRWRCPVVVEARSTDVGRPKLIADNIWLRNEVSSTTPRMYVRDFSGYYDFPATRDPDELIVLGDYVEQGDGGPSSRPPAHTWAEAELLPEELTGRKLARLSSADRSTYKVIRAVSEVECMGFFDSLNAWDNAIISLGPCHWTLGIVHSAGVDEGELCGLLGYLRHAHPRVFERAIGFFGLRADEEWVDEDGVPNGRPFFNTSQRKYAGWVALKQADGRFSRVAATAEDADYFRTWHWFYRFAMAGRTMPLFREAIWTMARLRIRDILSTRWPVGVVPDVPLAGRRKRPPTIGDVYTSECAVAVLLRWHVRFPAHVVSGGVAGPRVLASLRRARIRPGDGDTTAWGSDRERALLDGLEKEAIAVGDSGFTETMRYVRQWPDSWGSNPRNYALNRSVGRLGTERGSFELAGEDLPPPPY